MKKLLLSLVFLTSPAVVLAHGFKQDLYFGLRANAGVTMLQEFLTSRVGYAGPTTGNFFNLTKEAVKKFQSQEGITPVSGYFGPLTRARANALLDAPTSTSSQDELKAELTKKILELQAQIASLQVAPVTPQPGPPSPPPTPSPEQVITPVPTLGPSGKITISGSGSIKFPELETSSLNIGNFTVKNASSSNIFFAMVQTLLTDEMDSTANRGRKIYFLLRDGKTAIDPLISKTDFTIVTTPPKIGEPYRAPINFPLDLTIKAGEQKEISVWIEQLQYVKSGKLELALTKTEVVTPGAKIEGGFDFILTREPPL